MLYRFPALWQCARQRLYGMRTTCRGCRSLRSQDRTVYSRRSRRQLHQEGNLLAFRPLDIYGDSTPALGLYIPESLREIPVVSVEVLCVVLALAIDVILGLCEDPGAILARPLTMNQRIFDTHLDNAGAIRPYLALGNG